MLCFDMYEYSFRKCSLHANGLEEAFLLQENIPLPLLIIIAWGSKLFRQMKIGFHLSGIFFVLFSRVECKQLARLNDLACLSSTCWPASAYKGAGSSVGVIAYTISCEYFENRSWICHPYFLSGSYQIIAIYTTSVYT